MPFEVLFLHLELNLEFVGLSSTLTILRLYFLTYTYTFRFYFFTFFCIHLTAMCSACVNPFLYGWLNENISNQVEILKIMMIMIMIKPPKQL